MSTAAPSPGTPGAVASSCRHGQPQLQISRPPAEGDPALGQRQDAGPHRDAIAARGGSLGFAFSGVDRVRCQAEASLHLGAAELAALGAEAPGPAS